jgi:hypothetical protein
MDADKVEQKSLRAFVHTFLLKGGSSANLVKKVIIGENTPI